MIFHPQVPNRQGKLDDLWTYKGRRNKGCQTKMKSVNLESV